MALLEGHEGRHSAGQQGKLIATIKKCHQTLWAAGALASDGLRRTLQTPRSSRFRMKRRHAKNGQPYEFQIKTHEPSRRLAERIKAHLRHRQEAKDPQVFTDTIHIDDASLRTLVSHMEGQFEQDRPRHQGRRLRAVHGRLFQRRLRPVLHAARNHRLCREMTQAQGRGPRA